MECYHHQFGDNRAVGFWYSQLLANSTLTEAQRTTGDGAYTDKFNLEYTADGPDSCVVSPRSSHPCVFVETDDHCSRTQQVNACSQSQVFSVFDGSTNYCNMHNVYCNPSDGCEVVRSSLVYEETYTSCTQNDQSRCDA